MKAVVVGGGPAGLMAAEVLSAAGAGVTLYDAMPTVGRKFLLAGRGGLNLTHSEPEEIFGTRFYAGSALLAPVLRDFGPTDLRRWAEALGVPTFVGSSGRVFPRDMKAAPLLRAWLHRLRGAGVRFEMRHRWTGWSPTGALCFDTPTGGVAASADAVVLALGGASWKRLGSDGAWVPLLQRHGAEVAPLKPSNCGFDVATPHGAGWTAFFAGRFAGQPLKSVALVVPGATEPVFARKGEFVATATGIEGSLVYAASALLRDRIAAHGHAEVLLDLLPDRTLAQVHQEVAYPRGARSLGSHLKSRLRLDGIKTALLHELSPPEVLAQPARLAAAIKGLPLRLVAARPLDEAISTAGGVCFESLDDALMLRAKPGVFCAGEMLDWEAPTGGYLLTASMATGRRAARGALSWAAAAGRSRER